MHPRDQEPDMAAATGCIVGLALGLPITAAIIAAVVVWGATALQYAAWTVAVMVETAR